MGRSGHGPSSYSGAWGFWLWGVLEAGRLIHRTQSSAEQITAETGLGKENPRTRRAAGRETCVQGSLGNLARGRRDYHVGAAAQARRGVIVPVCVREVNGGAGRAGV